MKDIQTSSTVSIFKLRIANSARMAVDPVKCELFTRRAPQYGKSESSCGSTGTGKLAKVKSLARLHVVPAGKLSLMAIAFSRFVVFR